MLSNWGAIGRAWSYNNFALHGQMMNLRQRKKLPETDVEATKALSSSPVFWGERGELGGAICSRPRKFREKLDHIHVQ